MRFHERGVAFPFCLAPPGILGKVVFPRRNAGGFKHVESIMLFYADEARTKFWLLKNKKSCKFSVNWDYLPTSPMGIFASE